jgi:hypothetical protein
MADEQTTPKQCFVIGPVGDEGSEFRIHADWLLKGIIFPVFRDHFGDFVVERSDKIAEPGMVNSQIINRLHEAELVIADLSFHNANAFYEMAIRHKVGKPIIHMIRKGERIPFDVTPHRAILFSHLHPDDHEHAREELRDAVAIAIVPDFKPENPVTHARGRLELERHATPEMKVLANEMEAMQRRLADLEAEFVFDRTERGISVFSNTPRADRCHRPNWFAQFRPFQRTRCRCYQCC